MVATECLSEHMTALKAFFYQLVTVSLRLIAEVLGLGQQAKSRWTVNFQKLCDFQYLPDVENRRKNERTVSSEVRVYALSRRK
jgi:hypothetical protein